MKTTSNTVTLFLGLLLKNIQKAHFSCEWDISIRVGFFSDKNLPIGLFSSFSKSQVLISIFTLVYKLAPFKVALQSKYKEKNVHVFYRVHVFSIPAPLILLTLLLWVTIVAFNGEVHLLVWIQLNANFFYLGRQNKKLQKKSKFRKELFWAKYQSFFCSHYKKKLCSLFPVQVRSKHYFWTSYFDAYHEKTRGLW